MKLSVIIPVYNEEKTIGEIIRRVDRVKIKGVEKEIIVVDDGSADASASEIKVQSAKIKDIIVINHKKNLGKGAAVVSGIKKASGDYVIIQDADLEYDPQDYAKLIEPIVKKKAEVVYGTRLKRLPNFERDERTVRFFVHYVGNKFLSLLTSILYGQLVTDMETCYKMFPRKAVMALNLESRGFEFEPEITAKLLKAGYRIFEVPISTNPRGYNEGKKLDTIRDGITAVKTLIKHKFDNR